MTRSKRIFIEFRRLQRDIAENKKNTIGVAFLLMFRLSRFIYILLGNKFGVIIKVPYMIFSRILFCCDIPLQVGLCGGVKLFHLIGVVIHGKIRVCRGVVIRQNVTIGSMNDIAYCIPRGVEIGVGALILSDNLKAHQKVKAHSIIK